MDPYWREGLSIEDYNRKHGYISRPAFAEACMENGVIIYCDDVHGEFGSILLKGDQIIGYAKQFPDKASAENCSLSVKQNHEVEGLGAIIEHHDSKGNLRYFVQDDPFTHDNKPISIDEFFEHDSVFNYDKLYVGRACFDAEVMQALWDYNQNYKQRAANPNILDVKMITPPQKKPPEQEPS